MALARYNLVAGDIVLGNFWLETELEPGLTRGTFILSKIRDNGNGWTYRVRVGYSITGKGYIIGNFAYTINRLTLGNYVDTGNWNAYVGHPEEFPWETGYYMYAETVDISVPYGAECKGVVSSKGQLFHTNANWTFGGSVASGGFDIDPFPPSPIPPKPTFYLDNPGSITATSVYLNASMYGSKETLDYYHMGLWDRESRTWINRNLGGTRYADHIQFSQTFTGLTPEKYYQWAVYVENPAQEDQDNKNFYFTTLSWAKVALKVSGTWRTGIAYLKVGGAWRRSKQSYLKVNGAWRRSKDQ